MLAAPAGPPGSRRRPFVRDAIHDPGGASPSCVAMAYIWPSTTGTVSASTTFTLSGLSFHTPHDPCLRFGPRVAVEFHVCAAAESRGTRDGRRATDAIRAHVRNAGHHDYSGELAASQGTHRAKSRDASGSPRKEAAAEGHRRCRGGQRVLAAEYWPDHNRRFAQAPASADDFHVARPRGVRLDQVFRLEEHRTVSNDWVVRYDNRYLQIERQSHRPPAKSTVAVYEAATGELEIRYRDRVMRWTEGAGPLSKSAAPAPPRPSPMPSTGSRHRGQSADHPWHHGVDDYRTRLHLAAARRAWMAMQP